MAFGSAVARDHVLCGRCPLRTTSSSRSVQRHSRRGRLRPEALALLVVLLGGEAGLRCGEIMALEWTDITMPKGGRIRYVPE